MHHLRSHQSKPQTIISLLLFLFACLGTAQSQKTDLMILGTDHLTQLYKKDNPNTDVLQPQRQQDIERFTASVIPYRPDVIMVEVLAEKQPVIDSLYALYRQNKLKPEEMEDCRSEVYQLAFRMAKQLGLPKVYCVNAPGGTSQSILDNGTNIDLYKTEGQAVRATAVEKVKALQDNRLSLADYLRFVNEPATYNRIYHLRYITPARVTNGTFTNPDAAVDTSFINKKYIGAELISVFKNRDYKIYSNIVTTQLNTGAKKALLIIGAAHIGSLRSIFRDDDAFNIIDTQTFLNK